MWENCENEAKSISSIARKSHINGRLCSNCPITVNMTYYKWLFHTSDLISSPIFDLYELPCVIWFYRFSFFIYYFLNFSSLRLSFFIFHYVSQDLGEFCLQLKKKFRPTVAFDPAFSRSTVGCDTPRPTGIADDEVRVSPS